MAAQVGGVLRHHHEVPGTRFDGVFTAGALIALAGRIWLYEGDDLYPESRAHKTNPAVTARAATTMTTSATDLDCGRKGLKPMEQW